jgi:butyryl-CoA dehydrogenase
MFHMMNEERIAVGMGAVMVGAAGYYYALQYAKERKQGRLPGQKDPNSAPIPIIEHADVKRMLLEQKCVIEGMQLLGLYAATLVDDLRAPDTVKVHEADLKLELLTPVIKAWGSDRALEANALAIQILGGYGYTRDYPVEQCYRDNRINPIHEGTNGIQALDLLGRKIALEDGRALELLADEIRNTIVAASSVVTLSGMAEQLSQALTLTLSTLKSALHAMRAGGVLLTLANAEYAMRMMGTLCNAWCLLRMALAAPQSRHLSSAAQAGKLQCCTYFFEVHLPLIKHWSTLMVEEHACSLVMQAEWF